MMLKEVGIDRPYVISGKPEHCWMEEKLKKKAEEEANGLVGTTVALDGIAIIVNAENPVTDLTVEQIASIFTGETTDWADVAA